MKSLIDEGSSMGLRHLGAIVPLYLSAVGFYYLAAGKVDAARIILPANRVFNYYGFPWDLMMFGAFFSWSILKFGYRGFWLCVAAYTMWELMTPVFTDFMTAVFAAALVVSLRNMKGLFKPDWRALSVVLGYRVASVGFWQHEPACGVVLCPGTNWEIFAFGQIIYTMLVFGFVLESVGSGVLHDLFKGRRGDTPEVHGGSARPGGDSGV